MTEQERQLKKTQLYQDIDLLEKDFLRAYPLHPISGRPQNIIPPPTPATYSILILGLIVSVIICLIITPKSEVFPLPFMIAIILLISLISVFVISINMTPRYNKYIAEKKKYEKKLAELRRQYDAL